MINGVFAQTDIIPVINPKLYWLSGNLNDGNSYERFGNYNNKLFLIGWFDEEAFHQFSDFGLPNTSNRYRNTFGPINVIRTGWWNLRFNRYDANLIPNLHNNNDQQPLKFIVTLPQIDRLGNWISVNNGFEELIEAMQEIEQNRGGFDDIIGWYTVDEPSPDHGITPEEFKAYNAAIRAAEQDPSVNCGRKEIMATINLFQWPFEADNNDNLEAYAEDPEVTVFFTGVYPFHEGRPYFSKEVVSTKVARMRAVLESQTQPIQKPIIFNPQGFAHKCCGNENPVLPWRRVPSYAEYRHQIFSAIASGATGILPWAARVTYHPNHNDDYGKEYGGSDAFYKKEEDHIFGNVRTVYEELEPLTELMIKGEFIDDFVSWQILDPAGDNFDESFVRVMFFENMGNYYLIAINNNAWDEHQLIQPHYIRFYFVRTQSRHPDVSSASISVERIDPFLYDADANYDELKQAEETEVTIENNLPNQGTKYFTDYFEPGEVHIYRIKFTL
jgi:hypothetical protein